MTDTKPEYVYLVEVTNRTYRTTDPTRLICKTLARAKKETAVAYPEEVGDTGIDWHKWDSTETRAVTPRYLFTIIKRKVA